MDLKMRTRAPVRLTQASAAGRDWPTLCGVLMHGDVTGWRSETRLTIYVESVARCGFESCAGHDLGAWSCPRDAFEGRVFGGDAEVRWVRRDEGKFDAWVVCEHSNVAKPDAYATDRAYFLLGRGTEREGIFKEARYPCDFTYPLAGAGSTPRQDVRACVVVAEYEPLEPDWEALKNAEESAVTEALDSPLLCAHRFVRLDVSGGSGTQ